MSKKVKIHVVPHASTCGKLGEISPSKKNKSSDEENKKVILEELEKSFDHAQIIHSIVLKLSKEKEHRDGRETERWIRDCNKVFTVNGQISLTDRNGMIVSPHYYYEEYLKSYVGSLFLDYIDTMAKLGIFEIYKPEEKPILLYSCQRDLVKDFHPGIHFMIPLNDAIEYGIIFKDIATYKPPEIEKMEGFKDAKPVAYCLFHSVFTGFNFAFALFKNSSKKPAFRFAVFDRSRMDSEDPTESYRT